MSAAERINRLRAVANSVTLSRREAQDIRDVATLYELAEAWDTSHDAGRSERLVELRQHLKAMRVPA